MKTVHIIFNAHIDPIWLWPWTSGLDEMLATCRSACDRLDAHPDLVFTRGEAWGYDEIERLDPALLARIQTHQKGGRWEAVGGWWLQPDCNLPSGFAMERQIALGKEYFLSRFGTFPRIAYNVDSFGHAAALPGLMHQFGQDRYIMMRPQPQEMALPACVFRWRGYADGPEVTTFRIPHQYNLGADLDEDRVRACVKDLPEGIEHSMLFVGFGDHGGGPTERQIEWLRAHQNAFDGITLIFSSPSRFFDMIQPQNDLLPLVTGELQQHAIGCYSVYRPIKTALRKAEHLLHQAELFCQAEPTCVPGEAPARLEEAWKRVCFNQFHDTLGGTCLPSAYSAPLAQLGYAQNVGDTLLQEGLRRLLPTLPDDPLQRIVLYNASDLPASGPIEFVPWLDSQEWGSDWRLIDETGALVPFQLLDPENLAGVMPTLLFLLKLEPQQKRVLRIKYDGAALETSEKTAASRPSSPFIATQEQLCSREGLSVTETALKFGTDLGTELGTELEFAAPVLQLYADDSDTWSHNLDRYTDQSLTGAVWEEKQDVDQGPLMASWIQHGLIGGSRLTREWRIYQAGFAELKLIVNWTERHKLLKLVQPLPGVPIRRTDGVLGGWLERPLDGLEMPLRDGMLLKMAFPSGTASSLGIAAPDVYAADVTPERVRFTLLRSAIMGHHVPHTGHAPRRMFSDQGEHVFTFRYFAGDGVTAALLDQHAIQMQRPPAIADLTRGMPTLRFDKPLRSQTKLE